MRTFVCQQEESKVIVSIEDSDANTRGHELFVQRLSIYGQKSGSRLKVITLSGP